MSTSKLRSSSPFRSPADPSFNARRPSWTPSIAADSSTQDGGRASSKHGLPAYNNPLKRRRPSFVLAMPETYQRARKPRVEPEKSPEVVVSSDAGGGQAGSPQDGKSLHSSWEINVKDLVGDAVGSMSISPTSRDIVLAARRGLFIIDLDHPLRIPRFLPQGGTWDVADVQWNPHPSNAQYIVSTSSEKLLIWNLRLGGKTSIEHILKSHYRAITDINWHTSECDIVVSTGIDSWIWAWDIREPKKPIFGLSAFQGKLTQRVHDRRAHLSVAGGTQVKWNYQDANILASSHSNEVLIWDRRKGSLPVTKIAAHTSKIYGIDWSRTSRNEIVTCSLDHSIKKWDINDHTNAQGGSEPKSMVTTTYPVWRARNLPFGEGILSMPQRGETTLELYANVDPSAQHPSLVETFEGHSDVVKEFVWRRGPQDDFQLITWSKDRTLRFWPIDEDVMQKVGYVPQIVRGRSKYTLYDREHGLSFWNPPDLESPDQPPNTISVPFGKREILGEVVTKQPRKGKFPLRQNNQQTYDHDNSTPTLTSRSIAFIPGQSVGGTMSKGGVGTRNATKVGVDQLSWLASVKVGSKRGSSSGGGSRGERDRDSAAPSRLHSGSRTRNDESRLPVSASGSMVPERSLSETGIEGSQRSNSLSRNATGDERKDKDNESQTLQDEITSVLTRLSATKIKLEKHDLTKKRTCTLGLHGPWGETSSVFMRITFTFPRDYPQATYPYGTPAVELERNPLISMRDRAYILKYLRRIRERKRPCLEACLRFLLFAEESDNHRGFQDSESSSDEESGRKKEKDVTMSMLRNIKNLAEPRSSQGVFGPNGELICFFRAPHRVVQNVLRTVTGTATGSMKTALVLQVPESPSTEQAPPEEPPPEGQQAQKVNGYRSPALVSDAVRRLGLAAVDRTVPAIDPKRPEVALNILRAMTNLLTGPQPHLHNNHQHRTRHASHSLSSGRQHQGEEGRNYLSDAAARRSLIFITSTRNFTGPDRKVATDYIFSAKEEDGGLAEVCERNADAARYHGRYDHERIFRTLKTLFRSRDVQGVEENSISDKPGFISDPLAAKIIRELYAAFAVDKDVQMLGMVAMLILQTPHGLIQLEPPQPNEHKEPSPVVPHTRIGSVDYFSFTKAASSTTPMSPGWPRLPSSPALPQPPLAPSISSSTSSRGSWSSLFNTGSMRQFMNGVHDTIQGGSTTPNGPLTPTFDIQQSLSRKHSGGQESTGSGGGSKKDRLRKDSSLASPATTTASRSWNDNVGGPSKHVSATVGTKGHKPSLRFASNTARNGKKVVIFEAPPEEDPQPLFTDQEIELFKLNVYAYAEVLFRWQLFHRRLELLETTDQTIFVSGLNSHEAYNSALHSSDTMGSHEA
ncbi:hypothetical protein D9613_001382 [Agrocybe pediades]|uniref:Uncharacterized protein n=1 Tax=Agrocybe pediades TaxID=84607 RepID=A0A8H4VUM0_9AGAR|nr:hypothetical protein D9613_001382 [Agrocybe pediades]